MYVMRRGSEEDLAGFSAKASGGRLAGKETSSERAGWRAAGTGGERRVGRLCAPVSVGRSGDIKTEAHLCVYKLKIISLPAGAGGVRMCVDGSAIVCSLYVWVGCS